MKSEVVGVDLLVNETKENLIWLIETFASENDMAKLRVVMTDKDINERNRISDMFSNLENKSFCSRQREIHPFSDSVNSIQCDSSHQAAEPLVKHQ